MYNPEMVDYVENVVDGDLVALGVDFMREVTRIYGAERGQAIFEAFGPAMGDEIKGAIFFAMLTGEMNSKNVVFRRHPTKYPGPYQKVPAIKAIRSATGMGLKEAKDSTDLSEKQWSAVECQSRDDARKLTYDLRQLGFEIRT